MQNPLSKVNPASSAKSVKEPADYVFNTVLAVAFSFSALSLVQLGGVFVKNWQLSDVVMSTGTGIALTWAGAIGLATVMASYGLNDKEISDFTDTQSYMAYITAGGIVMLILSPALQELVAANTALSAVAFIFLEAGYFSIAGMDKME